MSLLRYGARHQQNRTLLESKEILAERKIIHIDMDAFFASVEQRDHPELRGLPIAVGHDGSRGVVSAASYEARCFGVHSAQSTLIARRRCPQLIMVKGNYAQYKKVSAQVYQIFKDYTDLVEPLSIDEAFLDVTENKVHADLAVDIAKEIKRRIREELQLTASAGVSYNKFLAKIASDYRKPDGLFVIHPKQALDFISQLPIEKFWGVGPKTADRMHRMGIYSGADLRSMSLSQLQKTFGKMGNMYYGFAQGIDNRVVESKNVRKSVGCEHTFEQDIFKPSTLIIELYHTVLELEQRLEKTNFTGQTLTLKIKYADFKQITRSITNPKTLRKKKELLSLAKRLLHHVEISSSHPIRLMGLSVSNPHEENTTVCSERTEGWIPFEYE